MKSWLHQANLAKPSIALKILGLHTCQSKWLEAAVFPVMNHLKEYNNFEKQFVLWILIIIFTFMWHVKLEFFAAVSVLQEARDDEKAFHCKIVCLIQLDKFDEALTAICKNSKLSE